VFDMGELLLWSGIVKVKHARFGKGEKIGQGTNYPGTRSSFRVTARIGDKEAIIISWSENDEKSKARMDASCAHAFAQKIANGETW